MRRLLRFGELGVRYVAQIVHAPQHVQLPLLGALGIDHRIEAGRGLGQAGQHRRLGHVDILQRLAEVNLRRLGEAVSALSQVDLVDVQLQNLVLGQARLDLEGEQRFVQLARKRFFLGQEKIPCHLHGNGRRSLTPAAGGQIGVGGADDALIVHAGVLIEALVFGRKDGLLHDIGDVADGDDGAALLAELTDQGAVCGVHPQRYLGLVIGKRPERGQIGIGEQYHQAHERAGDDAQSGEEQHRKGNKT